MTKDENAIVCHGLKTSAENDTGIEVLICKFFDWKTCDKNISFRFRT